MDTNIFDEYAERLERRRRDPATVRLARYAFTRYQAEMAGRDLLDPIDVEEVFAAMDAAWTTRRNVLQHVRSAYGYAHRRGVITLDPTYDVDLGRRPETPPRVLTNGELRAVLAAARNDDDLLRLHLFIYTGMRKHEVKALTWADVNTVTRFLTVMGKGGKLRRVPIHPALGELLAPIRTHGPAPVVRWIDQHWLAKLAPDVGFHTFRRTFATSLRRNGVQPSVIERICGWAPRGMLDRYYNAIADGEMHAGVLQAYRDDPL